VHPRRICWQVPKEPDASNPRVRTVVITGPSMEACDGAQSELMGLLHPSGVPEGTGITVIIPNEA
jgi:hypothetical protein